MRKFLSLSATLLFACAAVAAIPAPKGFEAERYTGEVPVATAMNDTRASGTLKFTYAQELYTAYKLQSTIVGKTRIYMAFLMRSEDIKRLAGNKVTGYSLYNPTTGGSSQTNPVSEVELFCTKDLNQAPEMTQTAKLSSEAWVETTVKLDSPIEITGNEEALYFGYSLTVPNGYYIPVDNVHAVGSNLILGTTDGTGLPDKWTDAGLTYGSFCLNLTVEGDNLPGNLMRIDGAEFPSTVKTGENASYKLMIHNSGANPVTSMEVTTIVGNSEPVVSNANFSNPLASGQSGTLTVRDIPIETEGFVKIKSMITNINGEVPAESIAAQGNVAAFTNGFDRNLVMEEATGTWCGFCPSGIVLCETITKHFGDRYFCISVHGGNDRMVIPDYSGFISKYIEGYPMAWTNRVEKHAPTATTVDGMLTYAQEIMNKYAKPTYVKVSATPEADLSAKKCKVTADVEFTIDGEQNHALNFVITESNIGPMAQKNYYAGGVYGTMAGWEEKESETNILFNDVARAYKEYGGLEGSIPNVVKAGEKYSYETELSLANCSTGDLRNMDLIVFITNQDTDEIINAYKIGLDLSGVESIGAEENGSIRYFNLQGIETARPEKGIYIKIENGRSSKVAF